MQTDKSVSFASAYHYYLHAPLHALLHRINCSQACGPFVNYTTSWEVVPAAVSQLPDGAQQLLYTLSSEAFAVSFFVFTWYAFRPGAPALIFSKLF